MRKVDKESVLKPASLTLPDLQDLLKAIEGDKSLINSDIYRGKIRNPDGTLLKEEVVEVLEAIYNGKCAYCEDFTSTEIEHYRPKSRTMYFPKHGGYFWLCYEWSNLIPSCHECNKSKSFEFPIKNQHVRLPDCYTGQVLDLKKCVAHQAPLIDEGPYLLHPEIDEPYEYLSFQIDEKKRGIALTGLDSTNKRGEETIRICNLNREELLRKRQEAVIFPIIKHFKLAFSLLSKQTISKPQFIELIYAIFEDLEREKHSNERPFTLLRRKIMESPQSFKSLITNQLPEAQQQFIQLPFESYFNSRV